MMRFSRCAVVVVFGLLLSASIGGAQVLSNLPGTGSGTGTNLGLGTDGTDRTKGVGLTVGATALDFSDMVALISNTTPASTLSGGIYGDSGGNPGTLLAAFTPVAIPENQTVAEISITTAAPFQLAAGTTYWFVLDGPATTNSLLWQSLNPNVAPTASPDVTFVGYRFSANGGTTWSSSTTYNGVRINADVVPVELQSYTVE
jgi:hypothetical protein